MYGRNIYSMYLHALCFHKQAYTTVPICSISNKLCSLSYNIYTIMAMADDKVE
jgi:hypothetical protein